MQSASNLPTRLWVKTIPHSKIVFPASFPDRLKYVFWRMYTPMHPYLRDAAIATGLISSSAKIRQWGSRQDWLLGTIAPTESIESVVQFLLTKGYGNHFVAWEDDGEAVSLRQVENFKYQYHVRIFWDGEVRAHYEYTPEYSVILHNRGVDFKDNKEIFLDLLKGKITPA